MPMTMSAHQGEYGLRRRLLDRHKRSSFGVNALWPGPID